MNRLYQIISVFLMISKRKPAFMWLFGLFLLLSHTLYADDLADSMAQLDKIAATLQKLEQEIASDQLSRKKLRAELVVLDRQTSQLYQERAEFEQRQKKIDQNIINLTEEKAQLSTQLRQQNDKLQRQIRLAYLSNQQSGWQNLLNRAETQGIGATRQIYTYINNARLAEIKSLNDLAKNLQETGKQLQDQRHELSRLIKLKAEQQTMLENVRKQKDSAHKTLNSRLADTEARLHDEQRKHQAIEKLIKKLSRSKPTIIAGGFRKAKGNMRWPVDGKILNRFGLTKEQNSDASWEGVATAASRGTEIHAIYHGQVIFADYLQGYGWLLIIDHGDEFMSLYAHAETLTKKPGEFVETNDVIGLVGDSGNVTRPTMYFEIRRQGAPVNPRKWCKSVKLTYAE